MMKNNPYIGPRPYRREDQDNFHGRNREARDLLAKIIAERVVLFYAQSGAGKSSLINAKVIPALEEKEGFHVLPKARVGSERPPGIDPADVDNIFIFSVMLTLSGEDVDPQTLLGHTLTSFLETYSSEISLPEEEEEEEEDSSPIPLFLIIDQFEELFTAHRERWQEARVFFLQVRHALETLPNLGIVFSMREDYMAALDPYAPLLPRRLRARFRMERLGPEGALEAVVKPAINAGCVYDPGVAEHMVDDMRRIKVQHLNKACEVEEQYIPGPHIEPVQLQVICSQLWDNLPEQDDYAIQWEEVKQYGDIDRALTDFYESAVTVAVDQSNVRERDIRWWFADQLITPMETRGIVLRGQEKTADLPNAAVDVLEQRRIIRADVRAGTRWYEICHDRLVDPIIASNNAWETARETPLRTAARSWQETGNASLLYRSEALTEAIQWTESNPDEVEDYETKFLEASQRAREERFQARRRRVIMMGLLVVGLVVMTGLTVFAFVQRSTARKLAEIATRNHLASEASTVWDNTGIGTMRSMLLARESLNRGFTLDAHQALVQGISLLAPAVSGVEHADMATTIAFSPDGQWAASGSADQTVQLWNVMTGKSGPQLEHTSEVLDVAFSSDGRWLVSGSQDGVAQVWDIAEAIDTGAQTAQQVAQMAYDASVPIVTFSPDGQWVASAASDGTMQVLETSNWQQVTQIGDEQAATIYGMTFCPNGQWLVSGNKAGQVQVWEIPTGNLLAEMAHEEGYRVWSVVCSLDNQWIVSGSSDRTVRIWETSTWSEKIQMIYKKDVWMVALSPDGRRVAAGGDDDTAMVWDTQTGRVVAKVRHEGVVGLVTFSPDGQWIASAGGDGTVRVWNAETGQEMARGVHEGTVWDIEFSPNGLWVISADHHGIAKVWNIWARGMAWSEHTDNIRDVEFSPHGGWVASASADGIVRVWEAATGREVSQIVHEEHIKTGGDGMVIAFGPRAPEQLIASAGEDGAILVWNVNTGQEVALLQHEKRVRALAFSPDGHWLLSGSKDKTAQVWEIQTGRKIAQISHTDNVNSVAFSPDGRWAASGSADNTVLVWEAATGKLAVQVLHDDQVWEVKFSPDGCWLATGSNDGTVRAWDISTALDTGAITAAQVATMPFDGWMDTMDFSPDGHLLAFGGGRYSRWNAGSGEIQVWDTSSWELVFRKPQEGWVRDVAFGPDSQWLVSGGYDGTARVWNSETGEMVALMNHRPRVYAVDFGPDGRWIVSGGTDDNARVWLWRPEDLMEAACARLPRNFTPIEWDMYLGHESDEPYGATCPNLPLLEE
ncbi:MAG: hypothetical protein GY832_23300 [Chloroflexi bacterium]|nr:hypothetical protein [Chloroflexota bacterium]